MANLRKACERVGRRAGRFSKCRGLRASLPDSLVSQAIAAPRAYVFPDGDRMR
jgi:hypothetical protein